MSTRKALDVLTYTGLLIPWLLKLRPEALYAFLYPVRTRQGPNRL